MQDNSNSPPPERLSSLIELAYHTSLAAEEGRFPAFRISVRDNSSNPFVLVTNFEVLLSNNQEGVAALKRLAPAADSMDHTLVVENRSDGWYCLGLASVSPTFSSVGLGRTEWHQFLTDRPFGIAIRVDGPGSVRVSLGHGGIFRLLEGRIIDSTPLHYVRPIRRLLDRIGSALTTDLNVSRVVTTEGHTVQTSLPILYGLAHIVASMQHAGFGGALIFPDLVDPDVLDVGKYKTSTTGLGLGQAMRAFYVASQKCSQANDANGLRSAIAEWQTAQMSIVRSADAIALMSRIDGCVVLDFCLNVLSFGAKIKVSIKGKEGGPPMPPVTHSGEPTDDSVVLALGTRNQSAYGLCRSIPNSTAIVVSQDGDCRVASSDSETVTFVDSLEASSLLRPPW